MLFFFLIWPDPQPGPRVTAMSKPHSPWGHAGHFSVGEIDKETGRDAQSQLNHVVDTYVVLKEKSVQRSLGSREILEGNKSKSAWEKERWHIFL